MKLNSRETRVLESIIDFHLKTGEAVGSRTLVKGYGIDLSPATIRNVMSDLESYGYIEKSHTSSGRAPTSMGYKFYVNSLLALQKLSKEQMKEIKEAHREDFEISRSAELLSGMTSHVGFALEPDISGEKIQKVELVYINEFSFLAVFVTGSVVKTKRVVLTRAVSEDEVKNLSLYLNAVFKDQLIKGIRLIDVESSPLKNEALILQRFIGQLESNIHLEGSESLVSYLAKRSPDPESYKIFSAKKEMREFLESLAEKADKNRINIILGDELGSEKLRDLSFVFSTYDKGSSLGMLGVIGPRRMEYGKVVSVVEKVSEEVKQKGKR